MLVTRGLGGRALVTAGLGDNYGPVVVVPPDGWLDPFEFHEAQFAAGVYRTLPRDARRRLNRRRADINARRHRGGA